MIGRLPIMAIWGNLLIAHLSTIRFSIFVALTLAYLLPLIRNLPEAVLGAIVVHAIAHLADVGTLKHYAHYNPATMRY